MSKTTKFLLLILAAATLHESALACDESPEAMNGYLNSILVQVDKAQSEKQLQKRIAHPLACLLSTYKNSSGVTKYLAGACLRPLLGGKEVKEIKKDSRYDKLLKHLVFAALDEEDPLRNPALRTYSEGRWSEYVPFCRDLEQQELCLVLFPEPKQVLQQGEFIGASSMILLGEAYQKFTGKPKELIAEQLQQLYREIPRHEKLKRKVIDRLHRELLEPGLRPGLS